MSDQTILAYLINVLKAHPEDPKNKETLERLLQIQAQKTPAQISSTLVPAKQEVVDFPTIAPPGFGIEMTPRTKPCFYAC